MPLAARALVLALLAVAPSAALAQPTAADTRAAELADQNRRSEALNAAVNRANAEIQARNDAKKAAYAAAQAEHAKAEAEYATAQANYEVQLAAHQARVAAYQRQLAACKTGDRQGCLGVAGRGSN